MAPRKPTSLPGLLLAAAVLLLLPLAPLTGCGLGTAWEEFPEALSEDAGLPDAAGATDSGNPQDDAGHAPVGVSDAGGEPAPDAGEPDAGSPDAGEPEPDAGTPCGAMSGYTFFNCAADGMSRLKCVNGFLQTEACPRGCLRKPSGTDDLCMGTTSTWACDGAMGTSKMESGDYFLTAFGCWKDEQGGVHTDPGDNCIPACHAQAKSSGLCAGMSGPECEQSVNWFVADSSRFGCLSRLRITNPANGRAVVAVVLDAGPACWVERTVSSGVLDASGRINRYLFGSDQGASDRARVHVVEVDGSTPLGPVP